MIDGLFAAVGLMFGSVLTWLSTRRTGDRARIAALEARVDALERRNAILWRYSRELIDHIYRGDGPPPPPWPDELLEASS